MPSRKAPKTVVRTGVTTGTAVSLLFLSASAAFAAMAMTKPAFNRPMLQKVQKIGQADLAFIDSKPGVATFSDRTTLQLQTVYTNAGSAQAAEHHTTYYFADKNKEGLRLPAERWSWTSQPMDPGAVNDINKRVENVPSDAVYIAVQLDTINQVSESSEINNLMFIPLDRSVTAVQPPVAVVPPRIVLASSSPSGPFYPSLSEVLRFTVTADASSGAVIDAFTFRVAATDNARSGWLTAASGNSPIVKTAGWSLYGTDDMSTPLEAGDYDWALYATDGSTLNGSETVGYARIVFSNPVNIAAGTSKSFVLKVDTAAASSSQDDAVRFDILGEADVPQGSMLAALNQFQWDLSPPRQVDMNTARGLPVTGWFLIY